MRASGILFYYKERKLPQQYISFLLFSVILIRLQDTFIILSSLYLRILTYYKRISAINVIYVYARDFWFLRHGKIKLMANLFYLKSFKMINKITEQQNVYPSSNNKTFMFQNNSVVEHLSSLCKAVGSISSTAESRMEGPCWYQCIYPLPTFHLSVCFLELLPN